jgi:glyoxylase-like metal-dependent hydrolase (beta-lactamase superfamily II)
MDDRPTAMSAAHAVLVTGYHSPDVAATVGYIQDGDRRVVTDPGMVRHRSVILDPLNALGVSAEQVTDVVFSHHHPDHTLNAALFPNARVHDHWAIYQGDRWTWRDAEGYQLTAAVKLIRTPGHTPPRTSPSWPGPPRGWSPSPTCGTTPPRSGTATPSTWPPCTPDAGGSWPSPT